MTEPAVAPAAPDTGRMSRDRDVLGEHVVGRAAWTAQLLVLLGVAASVVLLLV